MPHLFYCHPGQMILHPIHDTMRIKHTCMQGVMMEKQQKTDSSAENQSVIIDKKDRKAKKGKVRRGFIYTSLSLIVDFALSLFTS